MAAFQDFQELVTDAEFLEVLQEAKRDPKGAAARKVVKRVLTFINLSASGVPWGSRERAGEMTKLMAVHRYAGPSSIFYSVAPDDVHNATRIRWSMPFTGPGCEAQHLPAAWLTALQGQQPSERIVHGADGEVVYDANEVQLQREAACNPVACAITFDHLLENVRENLLRRSQRRLRDESLFDRPKGIFGRPGPNHDVKECNKRATFHCHGQYHGGVPPALLGDVAAEPELCARALRGLDSQLQAELPLEYHAAQIVQRVLRVGTRRDAAFGIPAPPAERLEDEEWLREHWWPEFYHHAMMVVAARHVHEHCATCLSGKRGKTGCRMAAPWGHEIDETRCVQLHVVASSEEDDAAEMVEVRCTCCHAGGALRDESLTPAQKERRLNEEAVKRDLYYTARQPTAREARGGDTRALAVDIRRRPLPMPGEMGTRDASTLAAFVEEAQGCGEVLPPSVCNAAGVFDAAKGRAKLEQLLEEGQPLAQLLAIEPSLQLLRTRLHELFEPVVCNGGSGDAAAAEKQQRRDTTLQRLLLELSSPEMACRNGIVADFSDVLLGCTRGNAATYSLGAGAGSKAASMYQIKYMGKDCVEVAATGSVLLDAHKHVMEHESVAEDAGCEERRAKHFAQRVINHAAMELEAVQAAGLVLGMGSSGGSDKFNYYSGWDARKLARIVASGETRDINFEHELPEESGFEEELHAASEEERREMAEAGEDGVDEEDADAGEGRGGQGGRGGAATGRRVLGTLSASEANVRAGQVPGGGQANRQPSVDDGSLVTVDLIEYFNRDGGAEGGQADVYAVGRDKVACSWVHHYAYRDVRLKGFSYYEFQRAFDIRKMTAKDREWYVEETELLRAEEGEGGGAPRRRAARGRGRPCDRFLLLEPHPLREAYIIVAKQKHAIPVLAGAPPPREPDDVYEREGTLSEATERKRRRFAEFMLATYVPWHASDGEALELTYERWLDWEAQLEAEACLYTDRETDPRDPVLMTDAARAVCKLARHERLCAAGRLFDLENIREGFRVPKEVAVLLAKHRERARALWNEKNRPAAAPGGEADGDAKAGAAALEKLREKAARLRSTKDLATRTADAKWASDWSEALCKRLPGRQTAATSDAERRQTAAALGEVWGAASAPGRRTLSGGVSAPRNVLEQLKAPLVLAADAGGAAAVDAGGAAAAPGAGDGERAPFVNPFAEMTEEEYEAAAAAHEAAGLPPGDAPLNVQQRNAGRAFLRLAQLRKQGMARGETPKQIADAARREGLPTVTLVIGAGGTGKSALVHKLQSEFARLGLGRLLVTAYTGVASAPFGGPTLLSLLNMNLKKKAAKTVRHANGGQREHARSKFREECGAPIEEFGGVVIDEVSFIEDALLGHVDKDFQTLQKDDRVDNEELMGGLPLLLCGDNHQKPPPGATPWYKSMVRAATGEGGGVEALAAGPNSAASRGLGVLRSAPRVELTRLMRARTDPDFIKHQQHMRRTDVSHPVSQAFLKALHTTSVADVRADAAWKFAPIGVLSHVERDSINLAQLIEFAHTFNLPIICWKLVLADGAALEPQLRGQLYAHEPHLWGYFVEGAPVHLTETIKPVRKLVNGSPGLLDSLTLGNDADAQRVADAYTEGFCIDNEGNPVMTEIEPPASVNVVVGGAKDGPGRRLWHEVPLDNLAGLIPPTPSGEQVVPVMLSSNEEQIDCYSFFAAQQGIAQKVKVKVHQYMLAFALTDCAPHMQESIASARVQQPIDPLVCIRSSPVSLPRPPYRQAPGAHTVQAHHQCLQADASAVDDA